MSLVFILILKKKKIAADWALSTLNTVQLPIRLKDLQVQLEKRFSVFEVLRLTYR